MSNFEFRRLRADEIEIRVGQVKKTGFTCLLYKDARCDQNILDETVGAENWQRDHKELKGNIYCGVAIWDSEKNQWITKWDCGAESNTEKEKGEASDSFKRACVNWGIGRELYTAPFIWIEGYVEEKDGRNVSAIVSFRVDEIEYTDNRISRLVISGRTKKQDWGTIYTFGWSDQPPKPKQEKPPVGGDQKSALTLEKARMLKTRDGRFFADLTIEELKKIEQYSKTDYWKIGARLVREELEMVPLDGMTPIDGYDEPLPF